MDGLNFRAPTGILEKAFDVDDYGLFVPRQEYLQMEKAQARLSRLLNSETDTEFKMEERYYLTDVETTNNPLGNTNAIGAGVKLFGPQPLQGQKFSRRLDIATKHDGKVTKELAAREAKIEKFAYETLDKLAEVKPADEGSVEYMLHEVEHDQALTGGGFDNNKIGDVTKTAMKGMVKSYSIPDIANSETSKLFVESCLEFRDYLIQHGMKPGTLKPDGLSKVRFEQDNDGMFGFPVLRKGNAPLDRDVATRLLIDSGVDTRRFVGTLVTDRNSGNGYKYRIQDALAYVLDNGTFSITDLTSLVIFLARIQKHGWKMEDGKLHAKDGKARAVFPNSAIQACIEGMPINAYNRALQELKIPCFPSIQTKETRVDMIKTWMSKLSPDGYGFLAADWSQYDATIPGWGLATVIQLCVKPFFASKYYDWLDAVTYILTYKYFIVDEALASMNPSEYEECLKIVPNAKEGRWIIFGLKDYLISGAKFTHIGGSEYGICSIHLTLPKLLGYRGVPGPQAGDDTLLAYPTSMIHLDSKEATYEPLAVAAKSLGLDINPSKQIFYQYGGELTGVFLQDSYNATGNVWGIGSAYRPLAAVFFSERNRGLTIAEQMMAEISRMNQGADNPFVDSAVEFWLERERYLGALVKERGAEEAFQFLIETTGLDAASLAQRIEVGSFTYGVGVDQLRSGQLPILAVMDRVVSNMSFSSGEISEAIKALGAGEKDSMDDGEPDSFSTPDEEDILDD